MNIIEKERRELQSGLPAGSWWRLHWTLDGAAAGDGRLQRSSQQCAREAREEGYDKESAAAVAQSFAAVSQEYSPLDWEQLPALLPAGRPEKVNVFQVLHRIQKLGKTKSTLPIDIPDNLRIKCSLDLAEPLTDIINSCLETGQFPVAWRREWVTPVPKPKKMDDIETCGDLRKVASTSDSAKIFESFLRDWITKDIGEKMDINQFAGKLDGVGPVDNRPSTN